MLIEFTVRNYRSFRDEQSWTLTADPETPFADTAADMPLTDVPKSDEQVLPSAVLYGPNASGKTNVLRAIDAMQDLVLYSANSSQRGDAIQGVEPFQFDPATRNAPTMFEAVLIEDGVRYQYGFEATRTEITEEWLFAYPKGEAQKWFERTGNDADGATIEFGSPFRGQKSVIQQATRPNALFLSTAIQLNNDQVAPVYDWFKKCLKPELGTYIKYYDTIQFLSLDLGKSRVLEMMAQADLGIDGVEIDELSAKQHEEIQMRLPKGLVTGFRTLDHSADLRKTKNASYSHPGQAMKRVRLQYKGDEGVNSSIELSEESQGTQRYFALAGPVLEALDKGRVLVVDELDSSLHPMMVRAIVQFFHDPETNPNGAQLLFNTHDTTLLDADLFRRDQIWFTEKFNDGATRLYSLLDFEEPPDEKAQNLARRYLQGRYGAIPILQFSSTTPAAGYFS